VSVPPSPGPTAPVEIPFVPAHQRQSQTDSLTYAPLEDDTIIVVGQGGARQRKRKREKTRGVGQITLLNSGTSSGAAESGAFTGDLGEMDEFDYSKVSNLLDGNGKEGSEFGGAGETKKKKPRQMKGKFFVSSVPLIAQKADAAIRRLLVFYLAGRRGVV
jgi:exosome complex exonuclease RRP6